MKIEINFPNWKIFCKHNSQTYNSIRDKDGDRLHYCSDCGKVFGVQLTSRRKSN